MKTWYGSEMRDLWQLQQKSRGVITATEDYDEGRKSPCGKGVF